ncbi:biotin-dependent carboxyltransferase [SAR202 cluster bacterium AC-409-J13_OGT_754m]|nr:biotin-dependent carboxyltransferase [SAR202 cluster bacterium AC-409-J13_OGT_754m]
MTEFEVLEPGLLTTVQDLGRRYHQRFGVPVSGAMDMYASRIVNSLLCNDEQAAVLEITLIGPKLRFKNDSVIALAGADLAPRINGSSVETWKVLKVPANGILTFDGPLRGTRTYLGVPGGIDIPLVMGSRSTYMGARLGGMDGRSLKKGDLLAGSNRESFASPVGTAVPIEYIPVIHENPKVRILLGPQDDAFTENGITTFLSSTYTVSQLSDRVGYRLEGPAIEHKDGADILSDGIPFGAIQVSGNGQPLILMADRGVTGGYTKIGVVITADIWKIAQSLPGDQINFVATDYTDALHAMRDWEKGIREIKESAIGSREEKKNSGLGMRITAEGEHFEVFDGQGIQISTKEDIKGISLQTRRILKATVSGETYNFDIDIEKSA